ncbi:hypothetical protein DFH06DRAFT_1159870, partial [Mycena polygramma]
TRGCLWAASIWRRSFADSIGEYSRQWTKGSKSPLCAAINIGQRECVFLRRRDVLSRQRAVAIECKIPVKHSLTMPTK